MRFLFLFAGLIFAAGARADVVVLKNGDRVTGSVVKKDANTLTFKSALFGTVTMPWDQVDSITTDTPLTADLGTPQTVQGTVATSGGRLQIANQSVALADVRALRDAAEQRVYERLQNPGWTDLWAGTATLGFAGAAGNAKTSTFTVGTNAARVTRTDKTTLYFNAVKASAFTNGTTRATAQAVRGGLGYNRNLTSRVFLNSFNDWEYDRFQSLDLRVALGGGVGYTLWKSERGRLDVPVGIAWSHSKFDPAPLPKFTRNAAEFYWGDELTFKLNGRTNLTQVYRMFNNLTDTGQRRVNFDLGASTQIFRWLSWNLSFSDRYLSNPAPGRKTNDVLYTTGVGVNFAR